MRFFDDDGHKFKARIRGGAIVFCDFRAHEWPQVFDKKYRVGMSFAAIDRGQFFELRVRGFGEKGSYGNGSLFVNDLNDLIISDEDRVALHQVKVKRQLEIMNKAEIAAQKERDKFNALLCP